MSKAPDYRVVQLKVECVAVLREPTYAGSGRPRRIVPFSCQASWRSNCALELGKAATDAEAALIAPAGSTLEVQILLPQIQLPLGHVLRQPQAADPRHLLGYRHLRERS